MAGGRKRILMWTVAGVAAAIGIVVFLRIADKPAQRTVLPDGTELAFLGVDTARVRVNVFGTSWQRIAHKVLPEGVVKKMGIKGTLILHTNDSSAGMAILKITATNLLNPQSPARLGPTGIPISSGRPNPVVPTGFLISDDAGNEFDIHQHFGSRWTSNIWECAFPVPLVSHRAREYRMRFYFSDLNQPTNFLADFTFSQPIRGNKPAWPAPAPLPQTNQAGPVTMVLEKLTSLPPRQKVESGEVQVLFETMAKYRIIENGKVSTEWHVSSVTVMDEDGNRHPWFALDRRSGWGETEYRIPGHYSPLETRKFRFKLVGPRGTAPVEVEFLARPEGTALR